MRSEGSRVLATPVVIVAERQQSSCSGDAKRQQRAETTSRILTYNDRTVMHLHIKWGVALGPIVVGTRHLPPSRIYASVTNPR